MTSRIAKFALSTLMALLCAGQVACVKSNLDNAFDPASIPGMIIGLAISSGLGGGSSSSGSSVDTAASVCSDVTPTIVSFATPGTTTYAVPATVKYVTIQVIGGGGSGGWSGGVTPCTNMLGVNTPVAATASTVKIQGAGANLIEAQPGDYGACGDTITQGIGGSGGSPNGQAGSNGDQSGNYAAGGNAGTNSGTGGSGFNGSSGIYGGGGGGSGGKDESTFSNLAGQTLEITVGSGGSSPVYTVYVKGTNGFVQLITF